MPESPDEVQPPRSFVSNVLWTWVGAAANIASALVLSPYVIRKLGPDGYGLWILLFSVLGYYGLVDLGFRQALVYFTAHFRALGQYSKINDFLSTIFVYYTLAGLVLTLVALLLSAEAARVFRVPPAYLRDFSLLIMLTGVNWTLGASPCAVAVEAFQRFDLGHKVYVLTVVLRLAGSFLVLELGYGLVGLGLNYLVIQALGFVLAYLLVRRIFPGFELSLSRARLSTLREMWSYGRHSFAVGIGQQLTAQTPQILLGALRSPADVGFFGLPQRMLQTISDLVIRAGSVTMTKATQLVAQERRESVIELGIVLNRYCFALMMPVVLFVLNHEYVHRLILLWVGPEYARMSTPLVPVFVVGNALVIGGQFNSAAILYSLRMNKQYGRILFLEGVVALAGILLVHRRFGILGAALAVTVPMILLRGLTAAVLVCRGLSFPLLRYLSGIYLRPLLAALPVYLVMLAVQRLVLPGRNWAELIGGGVTGTALYLGLCYFFCLEPAHRQRLEGAVFRLRDV